MFDKLWLVVALRKFGFASKVEFNAFRVIRVIRGSFFSADLRTIHEIHETDEITRIYRRFVNYPDHVTLPAHAQRN